jgi:hypothetical protein
MGGGKERGGGLVQDSSFLPSTYSTHTHTHSPTSVETATRLCSWPFFLCEIFQFWYKKTVMPIMKVIAARNLKDCLPSLPLKRRKQKENLLNFWSGINTPINECPYATYLHACLILSMSLVSSRAFFLCRLPHTVTYRVLCQGFYCDLVLPACIFLMTWPCLLVFLLRLGLACLYFTSQNMSITLILTLECSNQRAESMEVREHVPTQMLTGCTRS